MFTKFSKFLASSLTVAMLATVGSGAVLAADATDQPGTSASVAVSPTSGTVTIGPGQWQWYTFRPQATTRLIETSNSDANDVKTKEVDEAKVDAVLNSQSNNLSFQVWSADDLNNWRNNVDDFAPTGSGTHNEFLPGDPLSWQGAFQNNGTYYLIVKNPSNQPASYSLNITGDVTFPSKLALNGANQPAQASMTQAQPAQAVASTGEMGLTVEKPVQSTATNNLGNPSMMSQIGNDASTAVAPTNAAVTIQPGQWQWYTFRSQATTRLIETSNSNANDVKTKEIDEAKIDAVLNSQSNNLSFDVLSTDDLNNWRNNVDDFAPTGSGTRNEFLPGDPLSWQGAFQTNNNYYLIVKNRGTQAATYTLSITGDVAFPAAGTQAVK